MESVEEFLINSDNYFSTQFVKAYKTLGIPQFIMIDPQKYIVQANAPRPLETEKIETMSEDFEFKTK